MRRLRRSGRNLKSPADHCSSEASTSVFCTPAGLRRRCFLVSIASLPHRFLYRTRLGSNDHPRRVYLLGICDKDLVSLSKRLPCATPSLSSLEAKGFIFIAPHCFVAFGLALVIDAVSGSRQSACTYPSDRPRQKHRRHVHQFAQSSDPPRQYGFRRRRLAVTRRD